jgi:hypothetical protein
VRAPRVAARLELAPQRVEVGDVGGALVREGVQRGAERRRRRGARVLLERAQQQPRRLRLRALAAGARGGGGKAGRCAGG